MNTGGTHKSAGRICYMVVYINLKYSDGIFNRNCW